MNTPNTTIKEASEILGCSQQYLRICLQEGLFDFGNAVQKAKRLYFSWWNL